MKDNLFGPLKAEIRGIRKIMEGSTKLVERKPHARVIENKAGDKYLVSGKPGKNYKLTLIEEDNNGDDEIIGFVR